MDGRRGSERSQEAGEEEEEGGEAERRFSGFNGEKNGKKDCRKKDRRSHRIKGRNRKEGGE